MKNKDSLFLQTPEMKMYTVTGIHAVYCTITRVGVLLLSLVQRPACLTFQSRRKVKKIVGAKYITIESQF